VDRGSVLDFARCWLDTAREFGMHSGPGYKRRLRRFRYVERRRTVASGGSEGCHSEGCVVAAIHDAELDQLEQELLQANQSLTAARDRLSRHDHRRGLHRRLTFPRQRRSQRAARGSRRQPSFAGGELRRLPRIILPSRFRLATSLIYSGGCAAISKRPMLRCRKAPRPWRMFAWC